MNNNFEAKIQQIDQKIEAIFPGMTGAHLLGNEVDGRDVWRYKHILFSPLNGQFAGSKYFFDKKHIVHFTTIDILDKILPSKSLWLHSLNSLEDPTEYSFASSVLSKNNNSKSDPKNSIYQISFCDRDIFQNNAQEFNMWRLYGQEGEGVALVFSLMNNPIYWHDFHLSPVQYGNEHLAVFREINAIIDEINKDEKIVGIDFAKLLPFHKSELYEYEKEVRLLFDFRIDRTGTGSITITKDGKQLFPLIEKNTDKKGSHMILPIDHESFDQARDEMPLLKLETIVFGYKDIDEKKIKKVEKSCAKNLGYVPKINQSSLYEKYWGNINTN
jgi:hypothetical protein